MGGPCVIFDIDGTIANRDHRLHWIASDKPDWGQFHSAAAADTPIEHMRTVYRALALAGHNIVLVTGRMQSNADATLRWLREHEFLAYGQGSLTPLYMRADGDHRADVVVKLELLARLRAHGWEPFLAFEDRTRVVEMWRAAGIPCAQVAAGDY